MNLIDEMRGCAKALDDTGQFYIGSVMQRALAELEKQKLEGLREALEIMNAFRTEADSGKEAIQRLIDELEKES